jgi:hypothetical protein
MPWDIQKDIDSVEKLYNIFEGSILCGSISDYFYGAQTEHFLNDLDIVSTNPNTISIKEYKKSLRVVEQKQNSFFPMKLYQGVFEDKKFDLFIDPDADFQNVVIEGYPFKMVTPQYRLSILEFTLNIPSNRDLERWRIRWINKQKQKARKSILRYQQICNNNQ